MSRHIFQHTFQHFVSSSSESIWAESFVHWNVKQPEGMGSCCMPMLVLTMMKERSQKSSPTNNGQNVLVKFRRRSFKNCPSLRNQNQKKHGSNMIKFWRKSFNMCGQTKKHGSLNPPIFQNPHLDLTSSLLASASALVPLQPLGRFSGALPPGLQVPPVPPPGLPVPPVPPPGMSVPPGLLAPLAMEPGRILQHIGWMTSHGPISMTCVPQIQVDVLRKT